MCTLCRKTVFFANLYFLDELVLLIHNIISLMLLCIFPGMRLVHEQLLLLTKCYDDEPYPMQHDKSWSETNYTHENNIWLVGQIWILLGFFLPAYRCSVIAKQREPGESSAWLNCLSWRRMIFLCCHNRLNWSNCVSMRLDWIQSDSDIHDRYHTHLYLGLQNWTMGQLHSYPYSHQL